MRFHKHQPAYLEQPGYFHRHQPWHGEVLEAGACVDQIEFFVLCEIARQLVRVADHIDIVALVIVEAHISCVGKSLAGLGRSRNLAAANFQNPHAWLVGCAIQILLPLLMAHRRW